jgi:hypothetical protein
LGTGHYVLSVRARDHVRLHPASHGRAEESLMRKTCDPARRSRPSL